MTIIVFQSDGLLQEGSTNLKLIELKVSKLKKDVFFAWTQVFNNFLEMIPIFVDVFYITLCSL